MATKKKPNRLLASEVKELEAIEIDEFLISLSVESDKRIYGLSSKGTVYLYNKTIDKWMTITKPFTKD